MLRFVVDDKSARGRITRREWLRIGVLGSLGWLAGAASGSQQSLSAAQPTAAAAAPGFGKAKSVIFIYASGGQSQFETWDPKPEAPAEVRGAFQAIPTAVPGTIIGEHL